ncbi:hypothetical protein K7A41_23560 [Sphingobacterium sp. InxBP1]|uniref:hypothetical protein n=1 Tax=Sphingobacterium sp. InxBP1 TaxID=2870328 RepID=UPI002244C24A|nr:hypothetical protein [Sphingobacterium sp. InxBP1]MCW8314223.1 hypothetical protein [Sphingobacterium sp. InxBP1]
MAEENKAIEWPGGANVADDFDFLMVGKDGQPIMKIPKEKLNEVIVINGEGVKAVAGGASSATPTILAPGPAGQNRKMEDVTGWFVNGTGNPLVATGTPWEAPAGFKNTNWWDGTAGTWSLGSSVPLPSNPAEGLVAKGDYRAVAGDLVYKSTNKDLTNLLVNSDFANGLTNWTVDTNITDAAVNSGILTFTGKGNIDVSGNRISQLVSLPSTGIVYIRVEAKSDVGAKLLLGRGTSGGYRTFDTTNLFQSFSANFAAAPSRLRIGAELDMKIAIKNVMAIDLTVVFGAGNEPSSTDMDAIISSLGGYYNGFKNVDLNKVINDLYKKANHGYTTGEAVKTLKEVDVIASAAATKIETKPFLKAINKAGFDQRAIKSVQLVGNPTEAQLKESGKWLRLFITYIRVINLDSVSTTIVQVAKYNTASGSVGNGNISVSSYNGTIGADENGILIVTTKEFSGSGLSFKIVIDTTKLRPGIDTTKDLLNGVELDTVYLYSQLTTASSSGEIGLGAGDSIYQFTNIPEMIGKNLGIPFLNCGVGGSRMSVHEDARYNELSLYRIADAIHSGDFTAQVNAINAIIPTVTAPKQRQLERTRDNYINTDFSKLTKLTLAYGTNDFTANIPIGEISRSNMNYNTIVGALNYSIDKISSAFPQIDINTNTPFFRYVNFKNPTTGIEEPIDVDDYTNAIGLKLYQVVDAIKETSALNHIPCLDRYRNSGFSKYNHELYYEDSTHLNALGAIREANNETAFLKSIYFLK